MRPVRLRTGAIAVATAGGLTVCAALAVPRPWTLPALALGATLDLVAYVLMLGHSDRVEHVADHLAWRLLVAAPDTWAVTRPDRCGACGRWGVEYIWDSAKYCRRCANKRWKYWRSLDRGPIQLIYANMLTEVIDQTPQKGKHT